MAKIQWQSVFETGIPSVDMQHKKLVGMINQLEDALAAGKGVINEEIGSVLVQLVEYTQFHFTDEEKIQKEIGYTDFKGHAESHRLFITQVKAILLKMKSGGAVSAFELMNFLRDWLINHIMIEDRRVGVEYQKSQSRYSSPLSVTPTKS